MNDMRAVIIPKSDQINADNLLGGPLTITINKVSIRPGTEQPVSISFDGDDGKPYKPCKSMCKVMVSLWGPDANEYVGRSMTLYSDPKVLWGGMAVGGIRISHMSHIGAAMTMALTATKGNKKPFTVKPLAAPADTPAAPDKATKGADDLIARIQAADELTLRAMKSDAAVKTQRDWLHENRPELLRRVDAAMAAATAAFADSFPGDAPPAARKTTQASPITDEDLDALPAAPISPDLAYLTEQAENCETAARLEQMQQAPAIRSKVAKLSEEDAKAFGTTITALREGFSRPIPA